MPQIMIEMGQIFPFQKSTKLPLNLIILGENLPNFVYKILMLHNQSHATRHSISCIQDMTP
jgi:hypothetical protein